jgi:hypothetical protein
VDETTGAAIKNSPEGMSYFIQSVSPDWIKETKLCELCVPLWCMSQFQNPTSEFHFATFLYGFWNLFIGDTNDYGLLCQVFSQ